MDTKMYTDVEMLRDLNDAYLESVVAGDVERFTYMLADDFLCTMADGRLLDKAAFLAQIAGPKTLTRLTASDVRIRHFEKEKVAVVHAETQYTTADGAEGHGRYTDVWVKRGAQWLTIAAHVTRLD